ncbi:MULTISPECIES: hypothetical protein [Shewanella]|uniref:DUF2147 domain-containing protein n=2 Tax=Shewanella indica TaxID=768528 RepID=A0ABU4QEC9_9GAMM|nr:MULTISPECIES: hypothetical protein [Shewanella]MCE9793408.1 hypothetical protein [Shewanella indica]MDX6017774.1 hypothetical protein [Shewanella indica]
MYGSAVIPYSVSLSKATNLRELSSRLRYLLLLAFAWLLGGCGQPLPLDKAEYAGEWQSADMYLLIQHDGSVEYQRYDGNSSTSISGGIQKFEGHDFEVGIGFLSSRFEVSEPPHRVGSDWQMVVDGVRLTRVSDVQFY